MSYGQTQARSFPTSLVVKNGTNSFSITSSVIPDPVSSTTIDM